MSILSKGYAIEWLSQNATTTLIGAISKLEALLGPLDTYHERVQHQALEKQTEARMLVADIPRRIIQNELKYFAKLIGADMHIQSNPYLRISRPGEPADNIGLHRDTWYGDTPYEISVWIPFTDTDEGNALRIAPGSHLWSEAAHPVESYDAGVSKGSEKHSLGFAYSPKRLVDPVETIPLPMKMGQMLVFPVSLLHGVEVNTSVSTRISMDCRLVNSLAPVSFSRSRDPNYYERLCLSQTTEIAKAYAANQ